MHHATGNEMTTTKMATGHGKEYGHGHDHDD
jgi:hypothetical protein